MKVRWRTRRLADVATVVMGQSPPGETYNEQGRGIPFFQGSKDFSTRFPKKRIYCTAVTRFAEPGDILFSLRAPIGEINRAEERCGIGRGVAAIRGKSKLDTDFLEYALRSIKNEWRVLEAQGAVFGNAKKRDLENLIIPWPENRERHAIAHILSTLDDKIELNRRMNETLEAMARALFKSWFVHFDPVVANAIKAGNPIPNKFAVRAAHYRQNPAALRLPEHILRLFPDRFVDSELGPIPEGWRVSTLGNEFNITMGQSPPGSTYNQVRKGLPFFQGRRDFGFRYPSNRVYCTEPLRIAKAGDTLVSVRAPVGAINMARETICIGRGIAAVRHKSGSSTYTYYLMLSSSWFSRYAAEGTVFGAITKRQLKTLPIITPPDELILLFDRRMHSADEAISSIEGQSQILVSLRDTLLPKLISGELRISNVEKLLEGAKHL